MKTLKQLQETSKKTLSINENVSNLTNFHPHAIKARKEVESAIGSTLHHDYDTRHLGYTSKGMKELSADLSSKGYTYEPDEGDHGEHVFTKKGDHDVTHRVTFKRVGSSNSARHVTFEHSNY